MSDLRLKLIQGQLNDIEENVRGIKATWGNTITTLDNIRTSLKADRQKAIDEAYQKGFEAGQHEATTLEYQQGLEDGKACNENGCIGCRYDDGTTEHSPCNYCCNAYSNQWSAKPCSNEKIKVGDEVVALSGKAIVFRRFTDAKGEDVCVYWYPDENRINRDRTSTLEKTGRHFPQVAELFKAMKGDAE